MNYKQWFPVALLGSVGLVAAYLASKFKLVLGSLADSEFEREGIFRASIKPVGMSDDDPPSGVCKGLTLTVENFTDDDLEINWNKTYYTFNGQTEEGFIHGGSKKALRTQMVLPRRTDVVFAKGKLIRELKPSASIREFNIPNLSEIPLPAGNQTVMAPLTEGVHGIYLCLKDNDEAEYKTNLSFELKRVKKKGLLAKVFGGEENG